MPKGYPKDREAALAKRSASLRGNTNSLGLRHTEEARRRIADAKRKPLSDRLWEKVDKDREDGCWEWTGYRNAFGYGVIGTIHDKEQGIKKTGLVHRVAYELLVGPIAENLEIDHLCRNRACCNPEHLEPIEHKENVRRGKHVALKTHCARGHEWIPENWGTSRDGGRFCAICKRESR